MSCKFFVLISSLLLSSCSLIGSDSSSNHTFESDYARVIKHGITSNAFDAPTLHDMYSSIFPSGYDNSRLRLAFEIPTMGSGDLTLAADAVRESYGKLSAKMSLTGSFSQGDAGDIEFKNVRGQFVTNSATNKYYGLIESLDIGGSLAAVLEQKISTLKPYLGKWWVFDYGNFVSSSLSQGSIGVGDFRSIFSIYIGLVQDVSVNGSKNILPILQRHPLLSTNSTGTLIDGEYVYPVTFSESGLIALAGDLSLEYSATGISDSLRDAMIGYLSGMASSGELRVSIDDPAFFSLTLDVHSRDSKDNLQHISMISHENETIFALSIGSGSIVSKYMHTKGAKSTYLLTIDDGGKRTNMLEYSGLMTGENIDADMTFRDPQTTDVFALHVQYSQENKTFSSHMTREQSGISRDILTVSGTLGNHGIESLSGELLLISQSEKLSILYHYHMNDDENFTLKIHTPSGDLDGDGRLKKDDILINMSVAGFSSTFEQKNNPDGSWAGKFQLPVGLIKWNGSVQNHTLDDLHIEGTSPLAGVKIDLTKKGDHVSGPYSIITQGQEVSSGTITLRKIPKYFDIRIDTILPTMALPSFFEFHNFTDIRWDKDAKIKEPEQAEPLTPLMLKGMKDAKKSDTDSPVDIDFTNL